LAFTVFQTKAVLVMSYFLEASYGKMMKSRGKVLPLWNLTGASERVDDEESQKAFDIFG